MPNIFGYLLLLGLGDLAISLGVSQINGLHAVGILMIIIIILVVAIGQAKKCCIFMSSKLGIYFIYFGVLFSSDIDINRLDIIIV